jgi:hypothetical protein
MNISTQMSVDYANQRNYLDELYKVYPIIPEGIREVDNALWRTDLPPKKWTQLRVGFGMIASSKLGGVQWQENKAKKDSLTGSLRYPQSRWSQMAATRPQRWLEASEFMRPRSTTGRRNLVIKATRLFPAKVI